MKKLIALCLVILLMFTSCFCDIYALTESYPFDRADVWYCDEIDFKIACAYNESGLPAEQQSVLWWNNEEYRVSVGFHVSYFRVDANTPESSTDAYDRELLSGTWDYRDGKLVFLITEDYLFDGAFQELTFIPEMSEEAT